MGALQVIARIHTELPEKFGVPRQSGLVPQLRGRIVFEPAYRNPDAVRGLEDFSHLWLIWQFSGAIRQDWSPTVRPPRLGGNRRMGVFATRSPFRPNHLGLSSVRLERVEQSEALGPVLHVCGADLMDGTPIFDIKPYLPYTDSHPDAVGGLHRWAGEPLPAGGVSAAAAGAHPGGQPGGPAGCAGGGSPPPVSGGPPAGVRHGLCGAERAIHRGGGYPHGALHRPAGEVTPT